jgi:serine/threonine protein kinase
MADTRSKLTGQFAEAVVRYARTESPSELGAMKVFKLREEGEQQALNRLKQEIQILQENRPGLPQVLDFNQSERWMVTEYFPEKTLEYHYSKYRGKPLLALKAFLSLVRTVEALHKDGIIHRDIKPANVFIRKDDELVLGDFGIVFLPDQPNRLTLTNESVGPHDYMPPWTEAGGRLAEVETNFDIYMLGKLLWCMISGRLRLQREWIKDPQYDVTMQFKDDPQMFAINTILEKCVVERSHECQISVSELGLIVSTFIKVFENGGQLLKEGVPRPCRVCGNGHYTSGAKPHKGLGLRFWETGSNEVSLMPVQPFACDYCGHIEFFKTKLS